LKICCISNLKFENVQFSNFQMSHLKNHRISNLGNCQNFKPEKSPNFKFGKLPDFQNFKLNYGKEELNYEKASKSISQLAFRIELQKSSFSKSNWEKAWAFGLAFSKAKVLKKPNQTHPKKITLSQRSWLENHFVCTVTNGKNWNFYWAKFSLHSSIYASRKVDWL
jgi:hypothetical protein